MLWWFVLKLLCDLCGCGVALLLFKVAVVVVSWCLIVYCVMLIVLFLKFFCFML